MSRRFTLLDTVETPMRDGCILRGDVWLPEGDGPWPVLLQRTPYRREDVHGAQYISGLEFQSALRRGMAVMVQDTRGRYGSDGAFVPFVHEGRDGADTIAWLRAQAFCDGRVAMFGASYVGATQVLAAAEDPEGLVAISPQLTTARHGETWAFRGGAAELGFSLLWAIEALALPDLDRRRSRLPPEAAARLDAVMARLMADPDAAFSALPVLDDDLMELASYLAGWLDAARASASGADAEHRAEIAASRPAMLVTAGWNDIFCEGSLELFSLARARAEAIGDDRLIIGPWSHGNPKDRQGELWHGYAASTAALSEAQVDFFAGVLGGASPPGPPVRYFRSGSNSWHGAPDWPLPGIRTVRHHLDGTALAAAPPPVETPRRFIADPAVPVPTRGGATFLPGLLLGQNSGPKDQAGIEARGDVLVWTSPPLDVPLEVTGLVRLRLVVASSAPTCDWTARLCLVDPGGRSLGLVDGILRWTSPGGRAEVEIRLGHVSHLFGAGDRIRLQVASSNFPRFDRNPQSGVDPARATATDFQSAEQVVFGGELLLPVVPEAFPVLRGP